MEAVDARINDVWPLRLMPHRAEFHASRPLWEHGRLASMYEALEPGWTVYDVGAEEGDFTSLYRSWVGGQGRVVAVECSPGYWPAIRQTWEANAYPEPPACYVGFASDETAWPPYSVHWTPDIEAAFLPEVEPAFTGWPICSVGEVVPDYGFRALCERKADTPQWRLDALPFEPDAITMDVEGAEWHVLAGAERWLTDARPLVWVSVHEDNMLSAYGRTLADIHRLMDFYRYDPTELPWNGEGERFWLYEPRRP